jgi:hypothetical protein
LLKDLIRPQRRKRGPSSKRSKIEEHEVPEGAKPSTNKKGRGRPKKATSETKKLVRFVPAILKRRGDGPSVPHEVPAIRRGPGRPKKDTSEKRRRGDGPVPK